MKRQEELEAALVVVGVFSLALLTLLLILKWDDLMYCCRKMCSFFRSRFQDNAVESVHSYSNLNELLFDADETRGGRLRREGDAIAEDKETIAVETFFSDVLNGDSLKKTKKRSQSRNNDRPAEEPLL